MNIGSSQDNPGNAKTEKRQQTKKTTPGEIGDNGEQFKDQAALVTHSIPLTWQEPSRKDERKKKKKKGNCVDQSRDNVGKRMIPRRQIQYGQSHTCKCAINEGGTVVVDSKTLPYLQARTALQLSMCTNVIILS